MSNERSNAGRILYEYKQTKMNPYVWILLCLSWLFMVASTLALLGLPFYLAVEIHWLWAACALFSVPIGAIIFLILMKKARKHLIGSRYPDHYQITSDGLVYTRFHSLTGKLERQKFVPYTHADFVVVSIHALVQYEEREAGKMTEEQFRKRMYPAFHFILQREEMAARGSRAGKDEESGFSPPAVISVPVTDKVLLEGILEVLTEQSLPLYLAPVSLPIPGKEINLHQWKVNGMLTRLAANESFYPTFYELFIDTRFKYRKAYQHVQTRLTDSSPQDMTAAGKGNRITFPFGWISAGFLSLLLLGELNVLRLNSLWTGWILLVPAFIAYGVAAKPDFRRPVVFAVLCALIAVAVTAGAHYLLGLGKEPVIIELMVSTAIFLPASYPLYLGILLWKKRSSMRARRFRSLS